MNATPEKMTTFSTCLESSKIINKLHSVLHDSGRNFVPGFRNAGILSCSCFAHTLQLAINDGILLQKGVESLLSIGQKVVGYLKHSNVSLHALADVQAKLDFSKHRPVQDEPTCWNSFSG